MFKLHFNPLNLQNLQNSHLGSKLESLVPLLYDNMNSDLGTCIPKHWNRHSMCLNTRPGLLIIGTGVPYFIWKLDEIRFFLVDRPISKNGTIVPSLEHVFSVSCETLHKGEQPHCVGLLHVEQPFVYYEQAFIATEWEFHKWNRCLACNSRIPQWCKIYLFDQFPLPKWVNMVWNAQPFLAWLTTTWFQRLKALTLASM